MDKWTKLPGDGVIAKTIAALVENGINAEVVASGEEAKKRLLELLPGKAEVMNNTSTTMDTLGVTKEILESGRYNVVRVKLMDETVDPKDKKKLAAAADFVVGSVHAVTEKGQVLIASQSGSQIPAYAYGSEHVIWIVGTHKIVKNIDEGMKRIYEHSLPLEDARAQAAYGIGSSVAKILIINKEKVAGRMHLIFVNEVLGF